MIKITKTDHMNRSDQDDQKLPKRNQLKHQKMNKKSSRCPKLDGYAIANFGVRVKRKNDPLLVV